MKKQPTWLKKIISEYCYKTQMTNAALARKLGFKRQQLQAAMDGKIGMSIGLAKALHKETGHCLDLIQLTDGTLPLDICNLCKYYPQEILLELSKLAVTLKD